jgi:Ternary complex associated domain 9
MAEAHSAVLIGDTNQGRVSLLKEILQGDFKLPDGDIDCAGSFEQLKLELPNNTWSLVFIAKDLPSSENLPKDQPKAENAVHFSQIITLAGQNLSVQFYYLVAPLTAPESSRLALPNLHVLPIPAHPPGEQIDTDQIIAAIEKGYGLKREPRLPKIYWLPENARILEAQIRLLSDGRDLEEGKVTLKELIYKSLKCDQAEIRPLGQGRSGASVFRVCYRENDKEKEFVLKLCDGQKPENLEKIKHEVEGYQKAERVLSIPQYNKHVPTLREAPGSNSPNDPLFKHIVNDEANRWHAISYDFLGGEQFGSFLQLETALTADPEELQEAIAQPLIKKAVEKEVEDVSGSTALRNLLIIRETRIHVLEIILDWLCNHWYKHGVRAKSEERQLWNFDPVSHDKYAPRPPYSLSRNSKEEILNFLASREAKLGERLISDWDSVHHTVWGFIEGKMILQKLRRRAKVVISPVHGDLNANNVLLWLNERQPFFIDFPFFQENGHALHDLAQLEVEIKFSLMDRQGGSPLYKLRAYDHTYSQMALWEELENHLRKEKYWREVKGEWSSTNYVDNVALCLEMVQEVRKRAYDVRNQILGSSSDGVFFDEYYPALLYHTLRAIGFESLSVFKRLLAVYSAGKIIERMSR